VLLQKAISLKYLLRQTFVALQYMNTTSVIITLDHISDSSLSDCHLSKYMPTLTMVTEEGVAKNKEQKNKKTSKSV
jgi:hypothetical protein